MRWITGREIVVGPSSSSCAAAGCAIAASAIAAPASARRRARLAPPAGNGAVWPVAWS